MDRPCAVTLCKDPKLSDSFFCHAHDVVWQTSSERFRGLRMVELGGYAQQDVDRCLHDFIRRLDAERMRWPGA